MGNGSTTLTGQSILEVKRQVFLRHDSAYTLRSRLQVVVTLSEGAVGLGLCG